MESHDRLVAARATLADIEAKLSKLATEHTAATREHADADAALQHELGAERLGESSAAELNAARARHEAAATALRSVVAGRALLEERLSGARTAVEEAERTFQLAAAELIRPVYERNCRVLRECAHALVEAFEQNAKLATVVGAIPRGMLGSSTLLHLAGRPLEELRHSRGIEIQLAFVREPKRFTEAEILQRISWAVEPAQAAE